MKRVILFPMKLVWRILGPVRRALVREVETWLDRYLAQTTLAVTDEANMTLDFAAGELARMQEQVRAIRDSLPDRHAAALGVVGTDGAA